MSGMILWEGVIPPAHIPTHGLEGFRAQLNYGNFGPRSIIRRHLPDGSQLLLHGTDVEHYGKPLEWGSPGPNQKTFTVNMNIDLCLVDTAYARTSTKFTQETGWAARLSKYPFSMVNKMLGLLNDQFTLLKEASLRKKYAHTLAKIVAMVIRVAQLEDIEMDPRGVLVCGGADNASYKRNRWIAQHQRQEPQDKGLDDGELPDVNAPRDGDYSDSESEAGSDAESDRDGL
ncbi:hypothetical protein DFH09DRAFT_1073635 [Mycena vulgaris]|nr:hypothetical protein DFH09DRAFT_1073635 [Mycena vulgaris]